MTNFKDIDKYEKFYPSNCYGLMEILEATPNKFKVKFLDSGYEAWAEKGNVLAGKVRDRTRNKSHDWSEWNEPFVNNAGFSGLIVKKKASKCVVVFDATGYTRQAEIHNVRKGKINDPYALSFLGIGYLGEFARVSYWKQAKQLWSNVMKRCYNPRDSMGYYGKAFVDDRWLCFANFLEDLPSLENFDKWLECKAGGASYNFDKDLKVPGNKTYSKEACMFVTEYENKSAGAVNARALDKVNGRYN